MPPTLPGSSLPTNVTVPLLPYTELANGVVSVVGDIGGQIAATLPSIYLYCKAARKKTLTILLSSPGGDAYDALAIYDEMRLFRPWVKTVVVAMGCIASAASMVVLQGADKRLALPHTRVMVHEVARVSVGMERYSTMEDVRSEMKALMDVILDIMAQRSGRSVEEWRTVVQRRDTWMSAEQALELGLLDGIVSSARDVPGLALKMTRKRGGDG